MKQFLEVDGKPFIMLAGETHNSNASSLEVMERVWQKARELCLNTVLLPITWEVIEPKEGEFDFTLLDGIIAQARENKIKIGLLWFGTWKNAQCWYAPEWVKKDTKRFWRAEVVKGMNKIQLDKFMGMPYTTLSCHCKETLKADAKAFASLMRHLREIDEKEKTVILIQVENEPGLQGAAREQSDYADELFAKDVPEDFVKYMKGNTSTMSADVRVEFVSGKEKGNWKEVFGEVAEEVFQAYYVASYVETVAAAGCKEYELPMFVNAWLDKGQEPGVFPSGGPVARMMEVWKYCTPHIQVYAADIYVQNFSETCDEYIKMDNPLFIPETATHSHAAPRLVYVIGHYHAIGYAPFAFEDMGEPFSSIDGYLFGIDVDDPLNKCPQDVGEYAWFNYTLRCLMNMFTEKYGTNDLQAVIGELPEQSRMSFDEFGFQVMMDMPPLIERKDGVCLALQWNTDEFYLIASGCMVSMYSTNPKKPNVDIALLEEGEFIDGVWHMYRRLNGDEAASMRYDKPVLLKIKLIAYS